MRLASKQLFLAVACWLPAIMCFSACVSPRTGETCSGSQLRCGSSCHDLESSDSQTNSSTAEGILNCGDCGTRCPLSTDDHATVHCIARQCVQACNSSYVSVDGGVCLQRTFQLSSAGIRTISQRAAGPSGLALDSVGFEGATSSEPVPNGSSASCNGATCVQGGIASGGDPGSYPGVVGASP